MCRLRGVITSPQRQARRVIMKILVVEDEDDLRGGLKQSLIEQGYAVDTAADGEEATHLALENSYDAIILDVVLPRLDGWAVLREIRRRKKTPVIMLTSRSARNDIIQGLDRGADDYLTKPFDLREVHARVRAVIRRSKGHADPILNFGRVLLDSGKKLVMLDQEVIDLTHREYSLVEYLAFRRGDVVSRTELYEHLFADDDESMSNLLDVHVCNVRKKIDRDFIQTRRGHGYFLTEL